MAARVFVGWEEIVVSNDKGKRAVNYYVKDADGKRELAVVGKEKSARHMVYVARNEFLRSAIMARSAILSSSCGKWKSRREVVDWLDEIVTDYANRGSTVSSDRCFDDDAPLTVPDPKGLSQGKVMHHSKDFSWLGSAWDCRKRWKHYRSFCRNNVTISVHDFVYVMAEDYKRLVAYVEDLYEDLRANKMVVVRWFHKVDEVGTVLPPDVNDREIFFSLCLQGLSIECIDGLAAVLSAQDFDKFQNEASYRFSSWKPYFCRRQIDNDDIKLFDITQLQGYWSQEILRSMYATSETSTKLRVRITQGGPSNGLKRDGVIEPKKKMQRLNGGNTNASGVSGDLSKSPASAISIGREKPSSRAATDILRKQLFKNKLQQQQQQLARGSHVEVLSQDSGMRGCWLRGVVLKRHYDKVKVQYLDVQDADHNGNLEEWVLASRLASPDKLSIRLCGRSVVRPGPSNSSNFLSSPDVGSIVDARWHDGWWEGIVIEKLPEELFRVHFLGEQRDSTFTISDLRPSQDWVDNKWNPIKDRPDVANSFLSGTNIKSLSSVGDQNSNHESSDTCKSSQNEEHSAQSETEAVVPDLCRGLFDLHWNRHKKRKRIREPGNRKSKRQFGSSSSSSSPETAEEYNVGQEFLVPKSITVVERENCKTGRDPLYSTPLALCSNLVMSQ